MRYLGIGEICDLGDMYHRLAADGHEVKVYIEDPNAQDIFGGMISQTKNWRDELPWIKAAGDDGIIIFESASMGEEQDKLRQQGFQVIGGSNYGDRLENDREFGQKVFANMGLQTANSQRFTDYDSAIKFIRNHPGRYVFKINGASALRTQNYVGELEDGSDILALLTLNRQQQNHTGQIDFILMKHIEGIEVGIGAYFNGENFLLPACIDWEHKKLFPGSLGELTGEMGTVVTFRGAEIIFKQTLLRLVEDLKKNGHCGYLNINLIANKEGLWPLEFTSRFGYPGYAICEALQNESWPEIFKKLLKRENTTLLTHEGFATGVVLTVPPFPHKYGYQELSKGLPILFRDCMTEEDYDHLHLGEVATINNQLVTSGILGYIGVATGTGQTIEQSRAKAYILANKVVIPNIRYRNDIGDRVINGDYAGLKSLHYIE